LVAEVLNYDTIIGRASLGLEMMALFDTTVQSKGLFPLLTAARCVARRYRARDIETPIVFLFLLPRNATQRNAQP